MSLPCRRFLLEARLWIESCLPFLLFEVDEQILFISVSEKKKTLTAKLNYFLLLYRSLIFLSWNFSIPTFWAWELSHFPERRKSAPSMEPWTSHYFQLLLNLLGNLHRSTYVMQSACSLLTFKPKIILLYGVSLICCLLYFLLVLKFRFFFFL